MKKPKPPRARVKPSQPQPQPPQPQEGLSLGAQQAQHRRLQPILSWFDRTFRNVWFYIAAALAILNLYHTYRPELSLGIAATIRNDPVATLFSLYNTGSWTLYHVTTTCNIWDGLKWISSRGNMILSDSGTAPAGNSDIDILIPTQTATQDCGLEPLMVAPVNDAIRIDITAEYRWFYGLVPGGATRHFNMRHFGGQLILVPNVEQRSMPPPPPPS
jgi:hypothetical protein